MENFRMPLIGEKAPEFKSIATTGPISFPGDYKGKWIVFFSHPGDFTPVCTTEIMTFAAAENQFSARNAALVGLSVDSNASHIAWVRNMENYRWKGLGGQKVNFPIVADEFGNVARMYGMLMPSASQTKTVRNVYMIDPEGTVRAILIYPLTTGRSIPEIYRLLAALQAFDQTELPTPANWQPGESQLFPAPQTVENAQKRLADQKTGGYSCLDWYLCQTSPGAETNSTVSNAPAVKRTPPASSSSVSPISSVQAAINALNAVNSVPISSAGLSPAGKAMGSAVSDTAEGSGTSGQPASPAGGVGRPLEQVSAAQTTPGQNIPGQSMPMQNMPGQVTMPGQSMPAQIVPGQYEMPQTGRPMKPDGIPPAVSGTGFGGISEQNSAMLGRHVQPQTPEQYYRDLMMRHEFPYGKS